MNNLQNSLVSSRNECRNDAKRCTSTSRMNETNTAWRLRDTVENSTSLRCMHDIR